MLAVASYANNTASYTALMTKKFKMPSSLGNILAGLTILNKLNQNDYEGAGWELAKTLISASKKLNPYGHLFFAGESLYQAGIDGLPQMAQEGFQRANYYYNLAMKAQKSGNHKLSRTLIKQAIENENTALRSMNFYNNPNQRLNMYVK